MLVENWGFLKREQKNEELLKPGPKKEPFF